MEPDDRELIKEILNHYKWDTRDISDDVIDIPTMGGQSYKVVTTPSGYRHMDLSSVSTRDLLNECYRRRAIEKFDYKVDVDSFMIKEHPDIRGVVIRDLMNGLTHEMLKNQKFADDALVVKEEKAIPASYMRDIFRGEIYICKHPTKVRK